MSVSKHERTPTGKEEWLTDPKIIKRLGHFDLDPCAPIDRIRPWPTATTHYSINDDGLSQPWFGMVWMNPPYGRKTAQWTSRMALHGEGIALIYARTETEYWFPHIWKYAKSFYWFKGRLQFYNVDGTPATNKAPAPSVLVAYGQDADERLKVFASVWGDQDEFPGHYLPNRL